MSQSPHHAEEVQPVDWLHQPEIFGGTTNYWYEDRRMPAGGVFREELAAVERAVGLAEPLTDAKEPEITSYTPLIEADPEEPHQPAVEMPQPEIRTDDEDGDDEADEAVEEVVPSEDDSEEPEITPGEAVFDNEDSADEIITDSSRDSEFALAEVEPVAEPDDYEIIPGMADEYSDEGDEEETASESSPKHRLKASETSGDKDEEEAVPKHNPRHVLEIPEPRQRRFADAAKAVLAAARRVDSAAFRGVRTTARFIVPEEMDAFEKGFFWTAAVIGSVAVAAMIHGPFSHPADETFHPLPDVSVKVTPQDNTLKEVMERFGERHHWTEKQVKNALETLADGGAAQGQVKIPASETVSGKAIMYKTYINSDTQKLVPHTRIQIDGGVYSQLLPPYHTLDHPGF